MTFFSQLRNKASGLGSQLSTSLKQYRNRDYLRAIIAGCARIAAADGTISSEEKVKMVGFIRTSEVLKVFDLNEAIAIFEDFAGKFAFDPSIGRGECSVAIAKVKGDEGRARLLIQVCCAIGAADGEFSPSERAEVRRICEELALDPAQFDL